MTEVRSEFIRRHLSGVRRTVLAIVADHGPISVEGLAIEWARRHPIITPRHRSALPRMSGQVLWRLENLGWIVRDDGGFVVTVAGGQALAVGQEGVG